MKIIDVNINEKYKNHNINIAIALGNFDGFHIGHKKLINELIKIKKSTNFKIAVLLFDSHTKNIINMKNEPRLMSFEDKVNFLEQNGIDYIFKANFYDFKNLTPIEFLDFLTFNIFTKYIIVGEDYKFGKNNCGNNITILDYSKKNNILVKILGKVNYIDEKISSSKIIDYITNGEIELANNLLGNEYSIKGTVIKGYQRGRKLGYPTANLLLKFNYVIPKEGVYFTKTIHNNTTYFSFTSIGYNPTFENKESTIETNIFNFNKNIYGDNIEVIFIKKIRDNLKFNNIEELIDQLNVDKIKCNDLIKNYL